MPRKSVQERSDAPVATIPARGPAFDGIALKPISGLMPYARNARLHDESQLTSLEQSFREFGWTMPVLVDETGGVIAGHARLIIAERLGFDVAPVLTATGWDEGRRRAYILADNKLTERGGWDWELVAAELKDIRDLGTPLDLTGFEDFETEPLLAADWKPPEKPEATDKPHSATDAKQITVTSEQYETIMGAVQRVRDQNGNARMSEGKALEMIAGEYAGRD